MSASASQVVESARLTVYSQVGESVDQAAVDRLLALAEPGPNVVPDPDAVEISRDTFVNPGVGLVRVRRAHLMRGMQGGGIVRFWEHSILDGEPATITDTTWHEKLEDLEQIVTAARAVAS